MKEIEKWLVAEITKLRENLHGDKNRFKEGFDKGQHSAFEDVLKKINPKALGKIPKPK